MPVYIALTKNELTEEQKKHASQKITEVHCTVTGAPSKYVTVMFMSGYHLKDGNEVTLLSNIRTGGTRTSEVIRQLETKLIQGLTCTLDLHIANVNLKFLGIEPHWVFEGNEVLPVPGKETEV